MARVAYLGFALLLAGCHALPTTCDRPGLGKRLAERTGYPLATPPPKGQVYLPSGTDLSDGLTEEEAVVIALWNNAAFQELLTELDIAHADLVQAGLLPNPEFVYFFNVPNKPFKYAFELPIEALWLRPHRVAAARSDADRVCHRLTQGGLDLIRDVRQAYADVLLAVDRVAVIEEAVRLRSEIARLAEARLKAGDIGEQEAATARIDALQARQELTRAGYDTLLAQERLRNLMATATDRAELRLTPTPLPAGVPLQAASLADRAVASRPDAVAARESAVAATERVRLARLSWVRFLGILDATSGRKTGHEFGPAFRLTVPLFNCGEGAIARAEAELLRAERQQTTVRNQILLDVHQAHQRYAQARAELASLQGNVLPEIEAAIGRAEKAYKEGDTSYTVVLETSRQFIDARLRRAQLHADLRRAWADLERGVGQHLDLSQRERKQP